MSLYETISSMITSLSFSSSFWGKVEVKASSIRRSMAFGRSSPKTVVCRTVSSFVVYAFSSPPTLSRALLMLLAFLLSVPLKNMCSVKWASPLYAGSSSLVPHFADRAQYATGELVCLNAILNILFFVLSIAL